METIIQKLYVGGALATLMVGLCMFLLRRYVKQQDEEDKKLASLIGTLFEKLDKLREDFTEASDNFKEKLNNEIKNLSNDISNVRGYLNGRKDDK